ncbi:hypothetical protein C8Q80DRAFT_231131 [Daedaleopsis nitida]|nr:hypothetical protein C8Q80DRAFT_231131 [Daedaleopsis nitida]
MARLLDMIACDSSDTTSTGSESAPGLTLTSQQAEVADELLSPSRLGAWHKELVAVDANDGIHVVSSPNMNFVPQYFTGVIQVCLRADLRYGLADPIQYPQIYCEENNYLTAVLRQPSQSESLPTIPAVRYAPLWWTPDERDFRPIEGAIVKHLGVLQAWTLLPLMHLVDEILTEVDTWLKSRSRPLNGPLSPLRTSLRHVRAFLRHPPACSFRDITMQIREVQRYSLMIRAYMDFTDRRNIPRSTSDSLPLNPTLMGAFTDDRGVVRKLYELGIPVWYVRRDLSLFRDARQAVPIPPSNICTALGPGTGILYEGPPGPNHIAVTHQALDTFLEIPRGSSELMVTARPDDRCGSGPTGTAQRRSHRGTKLCDDLVMIAAPSASDQGVTRMQPSRSRRRRSDGPYSRPEPHPSQVRGGNKFEDIEHEWMPQGIKSWSTAMASVDLSSPAPPNSQIWDYWIPEPAKLLRPETIDRRDRYIITWLQMRSAWIYILRLPPGTRSTCFPTQYWRDFLFPHVDRDRSGEGTRNRKRWMSILLLLGDVFHQENLDAARQGPVQWFDYLISSPDSTSTPLIIWEMHDLCFRYELQALDRRLVPLQGEQERDALLSRIFHYHVLHSLPVLPDPDESLRLYDPLPHRRVSALEAFRQVLLRWPKCPVELSRSVPITTCMTAEEIISLELEMTKFYVFSFFEMSGRAPIVPHQYPGLRR